MSTAMCPVPPDAMCVCRRPLAEHTDSELPLFTPKPGEDECPSSTFCTGCGRAVCAEHSLTDVACAEDELAHCGWCAPDCRTCAQASKDDADEERAIETWKGLHA